MNLAILAARDETAQRRMVAAADVLASRFGLFPQALALQRIQERDAAVQAMRQREAVADLLDAVVAATDRPDVRDLATLAVIGPEIAAALGEAGITSLPALRAAGDEQLLAVPGIGKRRLAQIREVLHDGGAH